MEFYRVSVLFPLPVDRLFDYYLPAAILPPTISPLNLVGTIVEAPFGKKKLIGVIWAGAQLEPSSTGFSKELKTIEQCFGQFSASFIRFIDWVSRYTVSIKGLVLKMALYTPAVLKKFSFIEAPTFTVTPNKIFNTEQKIAAEFLEQKVVQQIYSVTLLDGVTGSGKTDVYFSCLEKNYLQGKQALVLLPEISLTPQWLHRFQNHFGSIPLTWHSDVSVKNKKNIWQTLLNTSFPHIVVGARSALFLPLSNLGLIIVDEEHENAYKQDEGVLYHGRDMAIVRAKIENIPLILASATPSLETLNNIDKGRYSHVTLRQRYGSATLPKIHLIDMRSKIGFKGWISPLLHQSMQQALEKEEQILLFLNRRGYAPVTLCRSCGHRLQCSYCSATLVDHETYLMCHLCGHRRAKQTDCPECKTSHSLIACGPGVDRLKEDILQKYPGISVGVISSDTLKSPQSIQDMLQKIRNKEISILIGTQMIAKGHDFPHLTVVGVIDADLSLGGGDPRAAEKTFQLLSQVSGRAGRGVKEGIVYVQTYQPHHVVMNAFAQQCRDSFLSWEKEIRKSVDLPPFGKLAAIIVSGKNPYAVEQTARLLAKKAPLYEDIQIWGPTPAPLSLVRGQYRWRLLLKTHSIEKNNLVLQNYIYRWLQQCPIAKNITLTIDVDPYNFM